MNAVSLRQMLTPADARRCDEICDRFEAAWKSGTVLPLESYLADAMEPARSWLLGELLLLEVEYRRRRGETPSVADYQTRFPEHAASVQEVFDRLSIFLTDARQSTPRVNPTATTGLIGESAPLTPRHDLTAPMTTRPVDDQRYEILELIGAGGIGRVYRAIDRYLHRELAIKVLFGTRSSDDDQVQRFVAEAQIGAQLQHTGIAPVYEMGYFADGRPFLAMKFVRGQTLATILAARHSARENLPSLLTTIEQVCQAIAYAHARQVVHRDLKPGNIMVGEFGEVQVMDWGLAKILRATPASTAAAVVSETPSALDTENSQPLALSIRTFRTDTDQCDSLPGLVAGTPAYMPPEQSLGTVAAVDQRADVFALGAILCEILTGRPPYQAASVETIFEMSQRADLHAAFAALRECGGDPALCELTIRCLAARPDDRPANAGEVAQEIAAYLAAAEDRLQQERLTVERQKLLVIEERKRRKLWTYLTVAMLAAGVLAGTAGLIWQSNRAEQRQRLTLAAERAEQDLSQARERLQANDINDARIHWNRAAARSDTDALPAVRALRDQVASDLQRCEELDAIRLQRMAGSGFDLRTPLSGYEKIFATYGLNPLSSEHNTSLESIKTSGIFQMLFVSLHDWAYLYHQQAIEDPLDPTAWRQRRDYVLQIVRRLNTTASLDAIYDAVNWDEPGRLDPLANELQLDQLSPQLIIMLGYTLSEEAQVALLRRGQAAYPDDLWMNLVLAQAVGRQGTDEGRAEAVSFSRAALALRPDALPIWVNLSADLSRLARYDEALRCLEHARQLDPESPLVHVNRGAVYLAQSDYKQAVAAMETAVRLQPTAPYWVRLALALYHQGDLPRALDAARAAVDADPESADSYFRLAVIQDQLGNTNEAMDCYRRTLSLRPDRDEARARLAEMLRNCGGQLSKTHQDAIAIDYLTESDAVLPDQGLTHIGWGMSLREIGQLREARDHLQHGFALGVAVPVLQAGKEQILGETERLVRLEEQLSEFLSEARQPTDAQEAADLGWLCLTKRQHAAALRFYQEAFRREPSREQAMLGDDRYRAVRAAVLAGCGVSQDNATLSDEMRTAYRQQGLQWLQQFVTAARPVLASNENPGQCAGIRKFLESFCGSSDLEHVRSSQQRNKQQLSAEEEAAWASLWQEIDEAREGI